MPSPLDRPGWELGPPNIFGSSQVKRYAVYHRAGNVGFWVEGDNDSVVIDQAQYKIDEMMLLRRIALDDLVRQDDQAPDTVTVHVGRPSSPN